MNKDEITRIRKLLNYSFEELSGVDMSPLAREGYDELRNVMPYIDKDIIRFDLGTVRGLAYYTGTVFEIFDKDKKYRALCGGGRYDDMIDLFGGQRTPATGFGMGYSTVLLLLKDKELLPEPRLGPDYFVAIVEDVKLDAVNFISQLRKKNSVDYDLKSRNLGNQLKYANSIKAKKLIVFGPDEKKKGKVRVKDMKTGKEKIISIERLI